MKKNALKLTRRSFLGTTGNALAGFAIAEIIPAGNTLSDIQNTYRGIVPGTGADASVRQDARWWEKEPLRIIEFEEGYEFREKFELLSDLGANMEHATRFTGTSPGTSFLDAHNLFSGKKVSLSDLEAYLKAAREKNIRVILYYNVHAIEIGYARMHPEWQQIKDDGKPIEDVYSVDSSFCINSPWREEVFRTLEIIAGYNPDGIFFDGPIFFSGTCSCASCKRLFREKYGMEMLPKAALSAEPSSPGWKEIISFQSDSISAFLRESNAILKKNNPDILFYMNGNTLAPSWPTGRDNRKIIPETDILGAEGGFLYGELKEPIYKPGAMAKLLETQSGGKPRVVFDAAKQGPWTFSTLPSGEISILYSQTITHQANVWLAVSAVSNLHDEELDIIRKYNRFIKANPGPFHETRSLARTGLVWPQETVNFYSGSTVPLTDFTKEITKEKAGNIEEEFYGFYDALVRLHIPFDVIDEPAIETDLSKYDALILPNVACLSRSACSKLKEYVVKGGNILSTFETSVFDENGVRLPEPGLGELSGIHSGSEIFGPLRWDYIALADPGHFALKGIPNRLLASPEYGLRIKSGAASPVMFCKPLPGSYSGSPVQSEYPFMTENRAGKGRSVYIAGTIGGALHKYHFPEYYQLIGNIIRGFSSAAVTLEDAPSSVEVAVRRKDNTLYIYLINFTSEMKRPARRIIPVSGIGISVPVSERIRSARALWTGQDLKFKTTGNNFVLSLPILEEYEIIELRT